MSRKIVFFQFPKNIPYLCVWWSEKLQIAPKFFSYHSQLLPNNWFKMLKGIASALLSRLLSRYFRGFESRNVNLSLGGEVELKELELNESILDFLDLPLSLQAGHLGRLKIEIPWSSLLNKPTVFTVEKLSLLICPKKEQEVQTS